MRATRRQGWWVSLLMASAVAAGCSRGTPGPAELFLDSVVSAVATSGKPDLWVSSVAGPTSTTPGSGYFITVTACNQGASVLDSQVKLYLSEDTSITAEDTLVGSTPTGPLHANQCTTLHVQTRGAPSISEGLWYLGALIDPEDSASEVSETNNSRAGTRMAIGSGPDLIVSRVSAPASLSPSDRLEATVQVCNTGTASASAEVDVYLLANADITSADGKMGSGSTGLLREGQCTTVVVPSTAAVPRGQWHVAAWVDRTQAVPELVESNNTRIGGRTVVDDGPDFTLSSVGGPATLPSGSAEPITVTATVCNEGNVAAPALVEVYLSVDSKLSETDVLVGSAPVEKLAPGQCAPVSVQGSVSVSSGLWHVAAWVDRANAVVERVEVNNIRLGDRRPAGQAPDLVLSEVSAPASVAVAQPVRAATQVCNQGTSPSAAATVSFFLSLDATITAADSLLGSAPVPELQAGACAPVELTGLAEVQEGSWHVGAYVDGDNRVVELSESNNTRTGGVLGVGDGADLYVSSISSPAYLQDSQSFAGQVTVCNQGTRSTRESARVGVFLSSDGAITASDLLIGDVSLPELAAGECTTVSVPGERLPAGTWYLGAIVDLEGREPELLKDNNIRVGGSLAIGSTLAALHLPPNLSTRRHP
ncbi:MAG TPA: CARDB domain-containing protein [Hyalangium sp.]|nr:CARDB domain-containing protein [Hyalangium sp.]